ncbi:MAG: cytochrome c [Ignavibacteriales bacterium]|nr:cytochrome c [Ignavibacteriales bacterium]
MTKAQIWTAAFLGLFVILFFLQKLTSEKPEIPGGMPMAQEEQYPAGKSETAGADLTTNFGCNTCHGTDMKGTKIAPTLVGLKQYYDRDKLINYLRNPQSYMDNDRFVAFKKQYKNIVMPSFNNKDVKDLGKIADYLLKLE